MHPSNQPQTFNPETISHSHNLTNQLSITMPPVHPLLNVLIICSGPAGLSTATALARQLDTAIVFDSHVYRNSLTQHMNNVPTWDHRNPADFRTKTRSHLLARYE